MRKIIIFIIIVYVSFDYSFAFYDLEDDEIVYTNDVVEVGSIIQGKPLINAVSAVLYDRTFKRVLFAKNMNEKLPNASTTKILVAIVACENGNMEDLVTISDNAAKIGGSRLNLRRGDKVTLNDLLFGLLLRSGNDAAIAIAEHIGGSVGVFCEMMNEKAIELGAINTHFTSPHGLDDENHYSSAYDLVILSDYALSIPEIANIVRRKSATIKINDYSREISNTNEMLSLYFGTDGVKTGYTGDAGRCLITSATRNGRQLISAVLGCNTKKQRTVESIELLDYGFQKYSLIDVCENMQKEFMICIDKAEKHAYSISVDKQFYYPLTEDEEEMINYEYNLKQTFEAPVFSGVKIGSILVKLDKETIHEVDVILNDSISRKDTLDFFIEIIREVVVQLGRGDIW